MDRNLQDSKPLFWPGTVLLGKYVVEQCLTDTPSRSVYRCYNNEEKKRRIELRVLQLPISNRPLSGLWSEIRKLYRIESPAVRALYDCARGGDKLLLFMEPEDRSDEDANFGCTYPDTSLTHSEFLVALEEEPTSTDVRQSELSISLSSKLTLLILNTLAVVASALGDEISEERLSGVQRVNLPQLGGPGHEIGSPHKGSTKNLLILFLVLSLALTLFVLVLSPPPQLLDWWHGIRGAESEQAPAKGNGFKFYSPKNSKSPVLKTP